MITFICHTEGSSKEGEKLEEELPSGARWQSGGHGKGWDQEARASEGEPSAWRVMLFLQAWKMKGRGRCERERECPWVGPGLKAAP